MNATRIQDYSRDLSLRSRISEKSQTTTRFSLIMASQYSCEDCSATSRRKTASQYLREVHCSEIFPRCISANLTEFAFLQKRVAGRTRACKYKKSENYKLRTRAKYTRKKKKKETAARRTEMQLQRLISSLPKPNLSTI